MLFILSPAKALDMSDGHVEPQGSPEFKENADELVEKLASLSMKELQALLEVSGNLADLNFQRFKTFKDQPCKAASLAFNGDAYIGWAASTMSLEDLTWAQRHVRILSGLYGVLRPLDPVQPYRLNMGTKLKTDKDKDLYGFWGDKIAQSLGRAMQDEAGKDDGDSLILVNVASSEYFKAVKTSVLPAKTKIVEVVFSETNGKILSAYCKKARGMFVRYAIMNRVTTVDDLTCFTGNDGEYSFRKAESTDEKLVFVRRASGSNKAGGIVVGKRGGRSKAGVEQSTVPESGEPEEEGNGTEKQADQDERPGLADQDERPGLADPTEEVASLSDRVKRRKRQPVANGSLKVVATVDPSAGEKKPRKGARSMPHSTTSSKRVRSSRAPKK